MCLKDLAEKELWILYSQSKSLEVRNELIERYLDLVHFIARKTEKSIALFELEYDDLFSFGCFGLIQAVERYDHKYGTKFITYAVPRIRGSIYDEMRKADWIPRWIRSKVKKVKRAIEEEEQHCCHEVDRFKYAKECGLNIFEYNVMNNDHLNYMGDDNVYTFLY